PDYGTLSCGSYRFGPSGRSFRSSSSGSRSRGASHPGWPHAATVTDQATQGYRVATSSRPGTDRSRHREDVVIDNDRDGTGVPRAGELTARLDRRSAAVDLGIQRADVGQVAVALVVVETVADDELVRDVESDVLDLDVDLHGLRLAQQRDDLERCGIARRE